MFLLPGIASDIFCECAIVMDLPEDDLLWIILICFYCFVVVVCNISLLLFSIYPRMLFSIYPRMLFTIYLWNTVLNISQEYITSMHHLLSPEPHLCCCCHWCHCPYCWCYYWCHCCHWWCHCCWYCDVTVVVVSCHYWCHCRYWWYYCSYCDVIVIVMS